MFGLFWILRNAIILKDEVQDNALLVDLIQTGSWHWIKTKVGGFHNSLFKWKTNPIICLCVL